MYQVLPHVRWISSFLHYINVSQAHFVLCWNSRILSVFFFSSLPTFSTFLSSSCLHFILVLEPKMSNTTSYLTTLTINPQNINPTPIFSPNITQANYPSLSQPLTIKLDETNLFLWKNQLMNVIIANGLEDFIEGETPIPAKFLDDAQL